jgi:hypothetical protein
MSNAWISIAGAKEELQIELDYAWPYRSKARIIRDNQRRMSAVAFMLEAWLYPVDGR